VLGVPLLVAAWLAEALHWYRQGRGMLLDGEGGIGAGANLGDAARWTLPGLLLWAVPWACSARRARAHGNTTIYTVEAEKGWYEQVANVDLVVFAWNRAAIRCYEKAGFREIGRRRGGAVCIGPPVRRRHHGRDRRGVHRVGAHRPCSLNTTTVTAGRSGG
jgi:hypothetical protein